MNDFYDLLIQLKNLGAKIYAEGDKIKVDIKSGFMTNEIATKIQYYRDNILALIDNSSQHLEFIQIEKVAHQLSYSISDAQRRLWVLSQFEGGSVAYNTPGQTYLNKDIDVDCFKRAIDSTIERHEILRTVFKEDETGDVRQWILKSEDLGFRIDYKDFRKEQNKEERVQDYITADSYKAFDLEKGPLLRASLLQVEDQEYVFYYNMHHIISDGWSMEVLSKDVFAYYDAYKENRAPGLKELRIQYKDYSSWQLAQLGEESFKSHRDYWLDSLSGELPLLDLPSRKQRPKLKTHNGNGLSTYIDSALTGKLKGYSQQQGGSLFMGLLAAWNVLMYRYTSQRDIIIGTSIAGREHADLEDQIGFYVNTLALRNEIDPEESFHNFYSRLKDNTLKSYSHQMYPFDRLVEELGLQRDTSRSAVFDVTLVLQNNGENRGARVLKADEADRISDMGYGASKFDIEISVQELGDYLSLHVVYNTDVYEREMVEGLITHYKQLLNGLLENPEEKVSQIDYLSAAEKHELLFTFNDTKVDYPKDKTIVDLFEEQVKRTPDNIAVVFEDRELSYKELNEKSNQLAHYLQENYEIKPDDLVGIHLDRSEWMIISILGVLKAGGAYVPIDPEYPQDRKKYMIKDASLKLLITEASHVLDIDYYDGDLFAIDVEFDALDYSSVSLNIQNSSNNLAYVIYTSGSTGKPKGVMIEHGNLIHSTISRISTYNSSQVFLLLSSISFDSSVAGIFGTLINGGKLILTSLVHATDSDKILEVIDSNKISQLLAVPTLYKLLLNKLANNRNSLKIVTVAGAECPKNLIELHFDSPCMTNCELYNEYGPTECTIWTSYFKYNKKDIFISTIGKPISNTQIYILNEDGQLQPGGVIGEICIGGAGLARGYLNQPELTAEKFVANPFKEGARMYKTGDLGRWLPDGNIEFIGRKDDQVKIRGYRIELGEIEHCLQSHKGIEAAVVVARENQNKEKELVAYITSKEEQNTAELRNYLKAILPEYMLPGYYVQLDSFALTSNGKIDKKRLPSPEGMGLKSGVEYVAPRNEKEKILASVWSDVLKREGIGVKDGFYNLGGDSIKSIQVVSRLKQQGYTLKVEHLLRTPVLEELSRLMQQTIRIIDQSEVKGLVEMTPVQQDFFEDPMIRVPSHYNQSILLKSRDEIDRNLLEQSIADLAKHHDALRMIYKKEAGAWIQINQDVKSKSYTVDFFDLRQCSNVLEQMSSIGDQIQSNINIGEGPLFRVVHFRLKDGDRLGLIIHHLVVDGVSWRIILEDLTNLYKNYKKGRKSNLPLKTDSFQRWAFLQKKYAQSNKIAKQRVYWEGVCSQEIECLPKDKEGKDKSAVIDSSESFKLSKKVTELLQTQVHGVYNTEINDILLTSLGLAIKEVFSREKSVLKMEGHGREEIIDGVDIGRTVGWFTSTYPFVLDISKKDQTEILIDVKESLRRVPDKGVGYGILKYLSEKGLKSNISPEIVFNYLGDFGENASNDENSLFEYAAEYIGLSTSKENGSDSVLSVSGMLVMGELRMSIGYSQHRYESKTIKKLINSYERSLTFLIENLANSIATGITPSDLSFKGLRVEELAKINADHSVEDVYELSPLQEGIYYHWLSEESTFLYLGQMSYRIKSKKLNIKNLKNAYDKLIARHAILRTSFSNDYAGRSLQIVRKGVPSNFTYEKIKDNEDKQRYVQEIKQKDRERGFDLAGPSQMRLHVVDLSEGEYEFIWSHHHILMDGWCMSVLINDFNQILSSETMDKVSGMLPVTPYSNYINWLNNIDKESSLAYWKNYLAGYSQIAEVPFKIELEDKNYVESKENLQIKGELFNKVEALCNQIDITQNTFIQGVWGYLLSRYNNIKDVVFGMLVSGRPAELPGVEDMVGLFINTIPVRVRYESNQTPIELLKALQDQSIQSVSHHYINLSEVQSQSELGMNLINHVMAFENYAVKELTSEGVLNTQREEGLSIESKEVFEQTNYDFNISIGPSPISLNINIIYNANRYDNTSLKRLIEHFNNLVVEFTEHANEQLSTLIYLSDEEKHELLFTFNDTEVDYPKDKTIVDLFEEQVKRTPDNIAVVFEDRELSYKELNEKSNQLAHYLQENYEIKPDDLIGIQLDRSEWVIISILGVLKAGGAYVPVDPEYPEDRITFIVSDSKCKVVIREEELNIFRKEAHHYSIKNQKTVRDASNMAYIIYTSGSSGKPKGVKIPHSNLSNFFTHVKTSYPGFKTIVQPFIASPAFDISVFQLFTPLLSGGICKIVSKNQFQDFSQLIILIKEVTFIDTVPSVYHLLCNYILEQQISGDFKHVERIFIGGDTIPDNLLHTLSQVFSSATITITYGPTEGTIFCTQLNYTPGSLVPNSKGSIIGAPIGGTQIYILDELLHFTPIGIVGEICIAGNGLAIGYLNNEILNAEKFITNPFRRAERLYKTGDIGKWLPDGTIEFIGRNDSQVKIRGFRIELGEIERNLEENEGINRSIVLAKKDADGNNYLVAYIEKKKRVVLTPSTAEFFVYDDLLYYALTTNEKRNGHYKRVFNKLLKDKVVLDLGTGADVVLSQFCIAAGARKVYAVEILEETYKKAKKRINELGLEDKITLIHGDITSIELPEKVDYCVSEIVGSIGGSEGASKLINEARRLLKNHANMIPKRSLTKIAAVYLPDELHQYTFDEIGNHYIQKIFNLVGYKFDVRMCVEFFPIENIISNHEPFEDLDFTTTIQLEDEHIIKLEFNKDSIVNGFIVWLNLYVDETELIDSLSERYNWLPIYLPVFYNDTKVSKGDYIEAKIKRRLADNKLNPDFIITGTLFRQKNKAIDFEFISSNHGKRYKTNPFYQKLFENDTIQIKEDISDSSLRTYLKGSLPDYMIPTHFVLLDQFPLTSNGKIDKKSLPNPKGLGLSSGIEYVEPRNEIEEKLVKIWEEVLQKEHIGIKDNFFALGGHSLKVVRLLTSIEKNLEVKIGFNNFFIKPTIIELSEIVNTLKWMKNKSKEVNTEQDEIII